MIKKPQDIKILISRDIPSIGINMLKKEGFQVTEWHKEEPMTPDELIDNIKGHNVLVCAGTDKIDETFLRASSHLDMISQFAAGYDNIDLKVVNELKIPVGNTPGAMKNATSDIAFGLMIAVSRKMFYMHKKIEKGDWGFFRPQANLGKEQNGKTLGVFGLGQIGMEMAKKCKGAYDMEIIYHNRSQNLKAEQELGAKRVSFEELLNKSDVISVHAALTEETRGIFNQSVFKKMKSSAIFINTSRGSLHNEEDLIDALQQGEIWGAGLDVTNPEPMKTNNPLLQMENVCVLPHTGSATVEARDNMSSYAAENIIEYYKGNPMPYLINPEFLS